MMTFSSKVQRWRLSPRVKLGTIIHDCSIKRVALPSFRSSKFSLLNLTSKDHPIKTIFIAHRMLLQPDYLDASPHHCSTCGKFHRSTAVSSF